MRVSKVIPLAAVLVASSLVSVSSVQAASECPIAGTLSTWGINSAGVFSVASGGTCLFPPQDRRRNSKFVHFAKTRIRRADTTQ